MFAGKKSAQIREILISESAWEEMTCLFAPSLKETRARLNGHNRVQQAALDARQAACDALGCADTYVRNKPWHSVGAAAAVGVFIGVLLNLRR